MIYVHIASGSPVGCCDITQSGTYEYQGSLPVRQRVCCFCTVFIFTVEVIAILIRSLLLPMINRISVSSCSFSHTKKVRRLSRFSFILSVAPRISQKLFQLTPKITRTEISASTSQREFFHGRFFATIFFDNGCFERPHFQFRDFPVDWTIFRKGCILRYIKRRLGKVYFSNKG